MMQNNELMTRKENNGLSIMETWLTVFPQLEAFTKKLHEAPPAPELKKNKFANNALYLPISFIQTKLDEVYAGLWNWEFKGYSVIANEVVGHGLLEVFHPSAGVWLRRSGTAAAMIQMVSTEKGGSGDITNIRDKITNTLVKDFPHLEAECLKSAAKKLGPMFGRDLNREHTDTYQPIYGDEVEANVELEAIIDELKAAKSLNELLQIWNDRPDLHPNAAFKKKFTFYRQSLNLKK